MDKLDRGALAEATMLKAQEQQQQPRPGLLSEASKRRRQQAATTPRKPRPPLSNIKARPPHEYVQLSAELERRLLDSRRSVGRQLSQRDASYSLLDKTKRQAPFKN